MFYICFYICFTYVKKSSFSHTNTHFFSKYIRIRATSHLTHMNESCLTHILSYKYTIYQKCRLSTYEYTFPFKVYTCNGYFTYTKNAVFLHTNTHFLSKYIRIRATSHIPPWLFVKSYIHMYTSLLMYICLLSRVRITFHTHMSFGIQFATLVCRGAFLGRESRLFSLT